MIYVLLCAFNEEGEITPLVRGISDVLKGREFEIVLVDDGSSDATASEARAVGAELAENSDLHVISHPENRGLGAALATGFEHVLARATDDDVLITLDADNTHPPKLIPKLLSALGPDMDVAIASRFQPGAVVRGVPRSREILSLGARALLWNLLAIPGVRDYTCCFRAYRISSLRRVVERLGLPLSNERGFAAVADILIRMRPFGVRASEIPLELDYGHRIGASKMNVLQTSLNTFVLIARRAIEQRKPGALP